MRYPTVNAESVYLHWGQAADVFAVKHAAARLEYQFFAHQMSIYMIAYWRNDNRVDEFKLDIDEEDVRKIVDEITEDQAREALNEHRG